MKSNIIRYVVLLVVFSLLVACIDEKDKGLPALKDHRSDKEQKKSCKDFNQKIEWTIDSNLYAENFRLKHHDDFSVLEIFNGPDTSYYAKGNSDSLRIFCPDYQWVKNRSQKIISLSSIYLPYFAALNIEPLIVGVANGKWIHNKTFHLMLEQHQIVDLGPYEQIQIEKILKLKADLIIDFNNVGNETPAITQAKKMHQRVLKTNTWKENHPLARSEWIKVIGWLTQRSELANEKFEEIVSNYNSYKVTSDDTNKQNKIKVIVADPYDGQWFVPAKDSYMAKLIQDAGGDYLFQKGNKGSFPIQKEEGIVLAQDADIWLNIFNWKNISEIPSAFQTIQAVQKKELWSPTLRTNDFSGNDFYESGVLRPDLILRDLRSIFYQNEYKDKLVYYQKLK